MIKILLWNIAMSIVLLLLCALHVRRVRNLQKNNAGVCVCAEHLHLITEPKPKPKPKLNLRSPVISIVASKISPHNSSSFTFTTIIFYAEAPLPIRPSNLIYSTSHHKMRKMRWCGCGCSRRVCHLWLELVVVVDVQLWLELVLVVDNRDVEVDHVYLEIERRYRTEIMMPHKAFPTEHKMNLIESLCRHVEVVLILTIGLK